MEIEALVIGGAALEAFRVTVQLDAVAAPIVVHASRPFRFPEPLVLPPGRHLWVRACSADVRFHGAASVAAWGSSA